MKKLIVFLCLLTLMLSGCWSCKSWHGLSGKKVPPEVAHKFFWSPLCRTVVAKKPTPPPPRPAPVKPAPTPVGTCGPHDATGTYPCKGCGIIQLDKMMPAQVQLKTMFDYSIKVTNVADMLVTDIEITERLPENFEFNNARPAAERQEDILTWIIAELEPGQSKVMTVTGRAMNTNCLQHCATVTYVVPVCANVEVIEPRLKLDKIAPSEVLLCDPIPVEMVVTNNGTGPAENVRIVDSLPDGITTADGKRRIIVEVGTLLAGESKRFQVDLEASETGEYANSAEATADGDLQAEDQTTTMVRQPVLEIAKTAPERRYLGRPITYEIEVTNTGDAPAGELVVEDTVPAGTTFVSATNGGQLSAGKVVWNWGTLRPGQSRSGTMTLSTDVAGTYRNTATATAVCAEDVSASAATRVEGIPAVLLEVIDIDDPVEIGNNTTYVIIATNQGSSPGTNISIVCNLEDNMEYVSSSGSTRGTHSAGTVEFAPLRSLAPGDKATWQVVVKAVETGDVRFKVTMNTDQIDRPVEETEATNLYE